MPISLVATESLPSWQDILSQCVEDPAELLHQLQLSPDLLPAAVEACKLFPLRVPQPFLSRIEPGNLQDPLLQQILPLGAELETVSGFSQDPLGEKAANPVPGLIHKYKGRVLLVLTGACAINCRYCFRRHFPYQDNRLGPEQWQQILEYIRADNTIHEVIFSGGDPLATPDSRFFRLLDDLEKIPHLKRLRIHSRLPIMIPQRITDTFCRRLRDSRLNTVMVIHANHANELDTEVAAALQLLRDQQITLLNQAVLLKGVNDSLEALVKLCERVFELGVLPYYLFTLDRVAGAAHFEVAEHEAQQLLGQLQATLPGYLVPRLAKEIAGEPSKTLILSTT
ncbi:EF-P beta-lysylation protein EpmB [Neptuniibacter sp. CAU 1671]|uniref:EF-P beta-lysylation protein EpmB n=1 Tax=Neptuniibacter sp. CAU 1671 TaxID=3032593 RepID=UPI0023DBC062|nr:EF-P beta-lysylation protein EpmB [Neptuniibacter sp. CAU 1671]MDF2181740.1 EF-P beta-lysylation protein EpmB [Neptuniibacter sp. CAU 1671]